LDTSGHARNTEVHEDGEEGGEEGGEGVVHTTVLVNLDDLVNDPSDEVHPGQGRGEREAGDDGVQRLRFELLADESNSFGGGGHCIY